MAFYPGAGLDISPIVLFPEIRHWYYMDSQPMSEFGKIISEKPLFVPRLGKIMHQIGFECIVHSPKKLVFGDSTDKTVTYYINSVFPDDYYSNYLPCSTLVHCGFKMNMLPEFYKKWDSIICNNKSEHSNECINKMEIVWDDSEYWLDENQTTEFITKHATVKR
jgi:hypothetical protein